MSEEIKEINGKPFTWYMRGKIWTFPRVDGQEPIPHLRKLPTMRSKSKWQIRRFVGPYYISTINLISSLFYLSRKDFILKYPEFHFSEIMRLEKEAIGFYETMIWSEEEGEYVYQKRYNSRIRAEQDFKRMVKYYKELVKRNEESNSSNSKEGEQ